MITFPLTSCVHQYYNVIYYSTKTNDAHVRVHKIFESFGRCYSYSVEKLSLNFRNYLNLWPQSLYLKGKSAHFWSIWNWFWIKLCDSWLNTLMMISKKTSWLFWDRTAFKYLSFKSKCWEEFLTARFHQLASSVRYSVWKLMTAFYLKQAIKMSLWSK